jgi:putative transposase
VKRHIATKDEPVLDLVRKARHINTKLGVKKIYDKLGDQIHQINPSLGRDKLFALLRRHDLLIRRRRKYVRTTDSRHRFRKYKNQFKDLTITKPHEAWVGDITFIRTDKTFTYLFLLTDAYSRKIVGWQLSRNQGVEAALNTVRMAIKQCPNPTQVVHHTDRGFQYCCPTYVKSIESKGIKISMGEAGNCYENAMAERVNGILKGEYGLDQTFRSFEQALKATRESIKDYNEERPHWSLKLKTPSVIHSS